MSFLASDVSGMRRRMSSYPSPYAFSYGMYSIVLLEPVSSMHPEVRLALEMALHEDEERRALSGELSVLHWAWRQEERLAAIADRLGLPEDLERQLEDLRARSLTPGS